MTISPSQRCGPLVTVQHFIRMEVELKKKTSLVRQRQTVCLYGALTFTRGVDSAVGPVVSLKQQQFDALDRILFIQSRTRGFAVLDFTETGQGEPQQSSNQRRVYEIR